MEQKFDDLFPLIEPKYHEHITNAKQHYLIGAHGTAHNLLSPLREYGKRVPIIVGSRRVVVPKLKCSTRKFWQEADLALDDLLRQLNHLPPRGNPL